MKSTRITIQDLATFAIMLTVHNLTMSSEDEYIRDEQNNRIGKIVRFNRFGMPMANWILDIVTSLDCEPYEPGCNFIDDMLRNNACTVHTPVFDNHVRLNLAGQALKHCMN